MQINILVYKYPTPGQRKPHSLTVANYTYLRVMFVLLRFVAGGAERNYRTHRLRQV